MVESEKITKVNDIFEIYALESDPGLTIGGLQQERPCFIHETIVMWVDFLVLEEITVRYGQL